MSAWGRMKVPQRKAPQGILVMFSKIKPILITAVIAIAAVYVWNKFVAPKANLPTA